MVIFTDRELAFLATLSDNWERLYRNELARLLREQAGLRGRSGIGSMRARRPASGRAEGRNRVARRDPRGPTAAIDHRARAPWTK